MLGWTDRAVADDRHVDHRNSAIADVTGGSHDDGDCSPHELQG